MKRTALRRKPTKGVMGSRPAWRENARHKQWVRGHQCLINDAECQGRIEFAHVRNGIPAEHKLKAGGMGLKPSDTFGVPLCSGHHREQHAMGEASFWKQYGIDPVETALELARKSPHLRKLR